MICWPGTIFFIPAYIHTVTHFPKTRHIRFFALLSSDTFDVFIAMEFEPSKVLIFINALFPMLDARSVNTSVIIINPLFLSWLRGFLSFWASLYVPPIKSFNNFGNYRWIHAMFSNTFSYGDPRKALGGSILIFIALFYDVFDIFPVSNLGIVVQCQYGYYYTLCINKKM